MEKETKLIYPAIASIMNEVDAIGKNKKNMTQGFMYRGIDDMYNELQPKFAKYKVFITSEVLECNREDRPSKSGGTLTTTVLKVKFSFYAEDGSSISSVMMGEAMDSGDKGTNKAMSIALKYCLMQLLLIPTEDLKKEDNDGHSLQPAARPAAAPKGIPAQPATLAPEKLAAWKAEINKCGTIDTLTNFYNTHRAKIDKLPQVLDLYNEQKQQLQPQNA